MGEESWVYDRKFYRELAQTRDSARVILPIVFETLKPASMVDVGCGAGHWLATATELGVREVLGVEGEWVKRTELAVPKEKILFRDLTQPLVLDRRFDLALSLEVAEHLPEARARSFVKELCTAADAVLFSAAIPGQGGRHHLNEQWPAYWAELFQESGYGCHDVLRPRIWNRTDVLWYYAQNCLLFVRVGANDGLGEPTEPLALVHPTAWANQIAKWNSPGKLLEHLPKSFFRSKSPF
jgi:hypothetical protein